MRQVLAGRLLVACIIVVTWSCVAERSAESYPIASVRDSAGIRIVTHSPGPFSDTIAMQPLLTIGHEGVPEYEFFRLRGVVSLASGNIVVANAGTSELRFFDDAGRFIRAVGQAGDGPAEFRSISALWLRRGDTLTVHDGRRRRLVHFDSAGVFVRGELYGSDLELGNDACPGPRPLLWGQLTDGQRVVSGSECWRLEGSDGIRRGSMELSVVDDERRILVDTVINQWIWERGSPPSPREFYDPMPLGPLFQIATSASGLYLTEGFEFEIIGYDSSGGVTTVLREESSPPEVTARDRDTFRAERIAVEWPLPDDVPFPDRHPSYSRLVISHAQAVWAQWASRPGATDSRWVVFSPDGITVRRLTLPNITVSSIRDGKIYGFQTDELGLQSVVVLDGS